MPFKDLDVFPKLRNDQSRQTTLSGTVAMICIMVMICLSVILTGKYIIRDPKQRLLVDMEHLPVDQNRFLDYARLPKLRLNIDIELEALPCPYIDFAVHDSYKEIQDDQFSKVKLKRIGKDGKKIPNKNLTTPVSSCGSCYGAASGCCNSCKDVRRAFKAKGRVPPPLSQIEQCKDVISDWNQIKDEKCHIVGYVTAPPVSGIISISPGDPYNDRSKATADIAAMGLTPDDFNLTHKINVFSAGENGDNVMKDVSRPQSVHGKMDTLYFARFVREITKESGMFYHTSVTSYYDTYGDNGESANYPGIFFRYDVAPITVITKRDRSFLRFAVDVMAIVGGVFSLGLLFDRLTNRSPSQSAAQSIE